MQQFGEYGGTIASTHHESNPWFPDRAHPGEDAPNVVIILLDDTGFAHFGCYGSEIDTPNIDRLAANGLQYTNFHVTPLCSPTRAALLTGRNHHSVGMRCISNFNTGFPNMTGHISNHAATVAEVLRDEGFTTFAVGKWHLCQMADASAAGPYDQWPLQRGFDRFYGFMEGETDQYCPDLTYDNHSVDPPARAEDGYHLSEDLVDRAIEFIHDARSRASRPTVLLLPRVRRDARAAPGAARVHAEVPRQVRRGLGRRARAVVRAPARDGHRPRGHRARAAQPGRRAVGRAVREPAEARGAPAGGVRRVPRPHRRPDRPLHRRPRRDRRARQHARVRPHRQRREPGGRAVRRPPRDEVLQRHPRDARRGDRRTSTRSAARTATRTTRGAGRRPATRRSSGTSRTPTRAASTSR